MDVPGPPPLVILHPSVTLSPTRATTRPDSGIVTISGLTRVGRGIYNCLVFGDKSLTDNLDSVG